MLSELYEKGTNSDPTMFDFSELINSGVHIMYIINE